MFFFGGLARGGTRLGVVGDGAVWIKAADGTVAFLQNAGALFNFRFDVLD